MNSRPTMFIGSSFEAKTVAAAVQSNLWQDIEITVWDQNVFQATKGTLEALVDAVNTFDFGVFVLSREDAATIREQRYDVVRDNVIFESGLFIGKLGRERVFLIVPHDDKSLHLPTDLLGTTTLPYDAQRSDDNWKAATSPLCEEIKGVVKNLGGVRTSKGVVAYGDTVVLQDFNGAYVQVEAGKEGTLTADSQTSGNWNKFEIVSATGSLKGRAVKFGDKIGLKSVDSQQFVGVDYNENRAKNVGAWVPELNAWETFAIRPASTRYQIGEPITYGMSVQLYASEDKAVESGYVAVKHEDKHRTFWAEAKEVGDWNRLMFVEPE